MSFTSEELNLLAKMESGALNGLVGDTWQAGKSTCWRVIEDGIPREYKRGPGGKFFNGKENERYSGVLHLECEWHSDELKIAFLRTYGWLMSDPDVRAYSAKFKPQR